VKVEFRERFADDDGTMHLEMGTATVPVATVRRPADALLCGDNTINGLWYSRLTA
jgi:hypothetical protein